MCGRTGEIISLGQGRPIRCPTCYRHGWVQRRIDAPAKQGKVTREERLPEAEQPNEKKVHRLSEKDEEWIDSTLAEVNRLSTPTKQPSGEKKGKDSPTNEEEERPTKEEQPSDASDDLTNEEPEGPADDADSPTPEPLPTETPSVPPEEPADDADSRTPERPLKDRPLVGVAVIVVVVIAVLVARMVWVGGNGANGGDGASGGDGLGGPSDQRPAVPGWAAPTVTLEISASSIGENGGSSRIRASLSAPSTAETTVTVSAAPGAGVDTGDYTLSGTTLTIAPSETVSAGALTLSAIDNAVDAPDKTVIVSGDASNALGVIDPEAVALSIIDDDGAPTVTLDLSASSIDENGGIAAVTAFLSSPSPQAVTVVVFASPAPPAVAGDFAVSSNRTLTIPAGETSSTGAVTITGVDNGVDAPDKAVTVSADVSGGLGAAPPSSRTLTIADDDAAPTVTLELSSPSIGENGGSASVTASLSGPSSEEVTVAVFAYPVSPMSGDFTISSNRTLTIAAGQTSSTGSVTITGVDDGVDAPDRSVNVGAAVSGGEVSAPSSRMLTITDDDGAPTVVLTLNPPTIGENGGSSRITASLSARSTAETTVKVSAAPGAGADTGDYFLSGTTLTIAPSATVSADALTLSAIDNATDAPDKTVLVSGSASNAMGVTDPAAAALTITDDEGAPTVALELSATSIGENGGSASVTAFLSGPSSEAVSVVVSASPTPPAVAGDFAVTSNKTLAIAAGATISTGTVTITGVDNGADGPDKEVTVSAAVSGGRGVGAPPSRTLTIVDDDGAPTVTLDLSAPSMSENGGSVNVTASLSGASSQDVTLTVSASPVPPAVSGDFTSSSDTLTIPAGSTISAGAVTITGVDNGVDAPDKVVTVSATVSGGGVGAPSSRTLTIVDDEDTPTVTLDLSASIIGENGGSASVTASLSGASSEDVTVTVSASPVPPAVSGDFAVSSNRTLTIAAGQTFSTGAVTVTGVDNGVDAPDRSVTVSAEASGGRGVDAPASRTLTIADDEETPAVTLHLGSSSIGENGGSSTITASLSGPSSATTTVTVSAAPGAGADPGDYSLSGTALTIAPLATASAAALTISAVDNAVDAPDKTVHISGGASNALGVTDPASVALTITDDDGMRTVTLHLAPPSIGENGGSASVTASLSGAASEAVTVIVSASPVPPAVAGDFGVSPNNTLTIPAGETASTGAVTITGVDNDADAPDKAVTVSAAVSGGHGVGAPTSRTLTITDDEGAPTVTLELSASSIGENGGSASVTASLSGPSSEAVTLTVSASAVPPAASEDFAISSNRTLTVAAGQTASTGAVTITGVDNGVDAPDKAVTVSAEVSGGGVGAPPSGTLTIADDEDTPTVTLELSAASIGENGGSARVTASLSGPSSEAVTLTVSASPVPPAVAGDFAISSNDTLTIAAGSTRSRGAVTITGVDNGVDAPDKGVTVSAAVSGGNGVSAPSSQTLTITDDDSTPRVTLDLSAPSISENGRTVYVTASLSGPSSEAVTLTVSASPVSPAVAGDFVIDSNTLTIAAGETSSTDEVAITGVDNKVDAPDKSITVSATVSGGRGVVAPSSRALTILDDESTPTVRLEISPSSIGENGGTAYVTASLSGPSSEAVTLTVLVSALSGAVAGDFTVSSNRTLTIAAGSTSSTEAVTITGVDNGVDAPDKAVIVSATASGGRGVGAPSTVGLTITDDE